MPFLYKACRCEDCQDAIMLLAWYLAETRYQLGVVVSNQEHIDAAVAELNDSFQKVADEVQALKDQVAAGDTLDFSGLDSAVARGQGLEPAEPAPVDEGENPAPVDEAPAPVEDAPVGDAPAGDAPITSNDEAPQQ